VRVFVVNCGSSSVKAALIETGDAGPVRARLRFHADRVGLGDAALTVRAEAGEARPAAAPRLGTTREAVEAVLDRLPADARIEAFGHRVVHGGPRFSGPTVIDDAVRDAIAGCIPLAPLHNPSNLAGIDACRAAAGGANVPHVAVFDTAFHASLPPMAWRYALPRGLAEAHQIRRYGFHGTSHAFVSARAATLLEARGDVPAAGSRIVTLHLGNGASACAVKGGRSVDTSMGMTPAEGLVMGTRTGDLDPAVPLMLLGAAGLTPPDVERALVKEGGLKGLSAAGSDMRDLLRAAAAGDTDATEALEIYGYRIRKYIGAYAAALGGLDAVAFTGGVGENAAEVRRRALQGLGFLGLELDPARNEAAGAGERDIAAETAAARVYVIPTDEETLIARETRRTLAPPR
jgi:acetate kinase